MKKTTKAIALLAASTMLAVSLTACGTPANTVFSADDLKGKKIGAQLGTTGYIYAGDVEDATVEPYNKGADAVQALKQASWTPLSSTASRQRHLWQRTTP